MSVPTTTAVERAVELITASHEAELAAAIERGEDGRPRADIGELGPRLGKRGFRVESEDEDRGGVLPPSADIYRVRQQKKAR